VPYRNSITTFFDILGFKSIVAGKEPGYIQEVLGKLRSESEPNSDDRERLEINSIAFSDSIVRSVPLDSNSNQTFPQGLLFYELFQLAYIQSFLIYEYGIFLRGAMTIADISIHDGIVFGPALVTAYELESKHAVYPRILVDSALFDAFEANPKLLGASHHSPAQDLEYLNHYSVEDSDGHRYINYLSGTHLGEFDDVLNVVERHYARIKTAVSNANGTPCVIEKYRWCARYHNLVVESWADEYYDDLETDKEQYLLTDADVPGLAGWKIPYITT